MSKHTNNGACSKCTEIFTKYPGFNPALRHWFEKLQLEVPSAHISCAGRGEDEQNQLLLRRATRAAWGQSAHNYGAAIDIFELSGDLANIYEPAWYEAQLKPRLEHYLVWYGEPGSKFFELPHVELRGWRENVKYGKLTLVG